MPKTTLGPFANPPPRYRKAGVFTTNSSKRWMLAPPMVSLYTLLLRIGLVHPCGQRAVETLNQIESGELHAYNHKPDTADDTDASILRNGRKGVNRILAYGDQRLFHKNIKKNYPSILSTYRIHDSCGLGAFANKHTKNDFPHWHRLEK